ncbi:dehydrogenase [Pseudomonas monteilii]|uniref:SDR family NAD(P)-dependent oxidoreductase n=1 Tax=Pseudomonas monteilii TaxID=76759 RepID=UPI000CEB719E|nr:SDR family NAD(P)-dependent oxidoreductase [Pseudomonas monteilii]AVH36947.1 dehydrogenase [Pseudomonas monteilii]
MRVLVIGASKGLGKAFMEGLGKPGDTLVGVSRTRPADVSLGQGVEAQWIEADLGQPAAAVEAIAEAVAEGGVDTLIYNLGLWEAEAFEAHYSFLEDRDVELQRMVDCNITATILLIKRLLPLLLESEKPRIILTGSTSGLPQSGRPEVTFAASKFALRGIAEALREGYRGQGLGVTCLNLGYLNTEDGLDVPVAEAAVRGEGGLIPLHDVVLMVRTLLELSAASYVRELILPAIADERF